MKMNLFPTLSVLLVSLTLAHSLTIRTLAKRQSDQWVWEDVDDNDVYRSRRYPQFNNNGDDFFIFDAVESETSPPPPQPQPPSSSDNDDDDDSSFDEVVNVQTPPPTPPPQMSAGPALARRRTPCEEGCLITRQYNPVCGTDMVSYISRERLLCAQRCGKAVEVRHLGKCRRLDQLLV